MARRRNREINIFNMSLLDILCGALGAFCFMMIALLPYYKPPGTDTETRKNQQKLNEKIKQLDEASKKMSDSPEVEDLRKLVEELKKQIQEMQGQLNQALAKVVELEKQKEDLQDQLKKAFEIIDGLTIQNDNLAEENEKLKEMLKKMTSAEALAEMQKRIDQLEQQMAQTAGKLKQAENEITDLLGKNEQLTKNEKGLEKTIQNRTPFTINVLGDPTQTVDLCIENATQNKDTITFNPKKTRSNTMVKEDVYFAGKGFASYMVPESSPETDYRIFLNLVTPPDTRATNRARVSIYYDRQADIIPPSVDLTPERPWIFYGTLLMGKDRRLTFLPATGAERDAMWERLNKAILQKTPDGQTPPSATPVIRPNGPPPRPTPAPLPTGTPRQLPGEPQAPALYPTPPRNPALDLKPSLTPANP